jgi:hypothetical protein
LCPFFRNEVFANDKVLTPERLRKRWDWDGFPLGEAGMQPADETGQPASFLARTGSIARNVSRAAAWLAFWASRLTSRRQAIGLKFNPHGSAIFSARRFKEI